MANNNHLINKKIITKNKQPKNIQKVIFNIILHKKKNKIFRKIISCNKNQRKKIKNKNKKLFM